MLTAAVFTSQEAKRRLEHEALQGDGLSGFRRAKRPVHAGAAAMLALQKPGAAASGSRPGAGGFNVLRPNTGEGMLALLGRSAIISP